MKTIITTTVGGSPEFYRLVDLDVRKREFIVTMRETTVRPDRVKEMNDELEQMNDEIAALKPVIRTQLAALRIESEPNQRIEAAATRGLLSLALDGFSSNGGARGFEAPSTKVGQYLVTDHGGFSTCARPRAKLFAARFSALLKKAPGSDASQISSRGFSVISSRLPILPRFC